MALPAWLTKKVGPLPVWGYAVVVGGAGIGYVLYKRRQSSATTATVPASAVPATADTSGSSGDTSGSGSGGVSFPYPPSGPSGPSVGPGDIPAPATAVDSSGNTPGGSLALTGPSVAAAPASVFSAPLGTAVGNGLNVVASSPGSGPAAPGLFQPASVQIAGPGNSGFTEYNTTATNEAGAEGLGGVMQPGGPVVPLAQRIPGERYNSKGQVIA